MLIEKVRPNSTTFVGVLSTYSHIDFVTQSPRFFASLLQDHGIIPTIELYDCMVGLFGHERQFD